MTENFLVSIIVPVYKAEQYIDECVTSILRQTYTRWELILVDDGSPDKSGEKCDSLALQDSRIRVIHKENSGVSDTRNVGINHSRGEKICFVDADDWLKPNYLKHLMEYAEYDYVIAGYETWPEGAKNILREQSYDRNSMAAQLEGHLQSRPSSWAALFCAALIKHHNIRFNTKLRSREDHLFNAQYLRWCNTVKVINHQEYIVRSRTMPIAIKFRMHSDDIILVIDSLLRAYKDLEVEFGYYPKDLRPTFNIMSQYYLEDFVRFESDDDYFKIYKKYFDAADKTVMYADKHLNSMNLMLDGILAYYDVKDKKKENDLMKTFGIVFRGTDISCAEFRTHINRAIAHRILKGKMQSAEMLVAFSIRLKGFVEKLKRIGRPLLYMNSRIIL